MLNPIRNKRVVVAMSGGVDSSVSAALLLKQGYEVIGITMCFNLPDTETKKPRCCGLQGIEDARRVAEKLGIKHYVLNMQKFLEEKVINDFCREYLRGRTPNPCVRCNQYIKFDALLKKALSLDAQFLATGHYAQIRKSTVYTLEKAKDKNKDQSYFLYRLAQKQLKHLLFPLGNYTKDKVRKLAKEFALPVADKPDSQEICFLPGADYKEFLKNRFADKIKPGLIVDKTGKVLGRHQGIAFYTIGQRGGLRIAAPWPLYVVQIDASCNQVIIGKKEDVLKKDFLVDDLHFISGAIKKRIALKVKIRYNHPEALAEVMPSADKVKVCFKKPQFAITPGQSAVFYRNNRILGGGIISEVLN